MVKEYKVIKPFGALKTGDILTLDNKMYTFSSMNSYFTDEKSADAENYYSQVSVAISSNIMEEYAKSGLVEPIENVTVESSDENKIKQIRTIIAQLKNTYNQRKNNIEKKYQEGKIQTCVKVEHDTVHFNMMKLLNKLETIINE